MMNKKISTLLLTGMMVMSMGTSAFAAKGPGVGVEGTKDDQVTVSVTKDLEFAEGITIPNTSFTFTATKITQDAPDATIKKIDYKSTDEKGDLKDSGKYVVTRESAIVFEGGFKHAGEYDYTVKEDTPTDKVKGMSYSPTTYTLRVYVANDKDGTLYVKHITAQDETGKKPEKVLFTNTYTKKGGEDSHTDSLVVRKETQGEYADKTKKFKFDVYFKNAATNSDTELTGKIGDKEYKFAYNGTTRVELSDGEELRFAEIPAGTRYTVTEVGEKDDYTPSVNVMENGGKTVNKKANNDEDGLCSANNGGTNLIGEKENKVTFVNTYKDVPVTGIIANNAPMILVAALGVLAMLGYALTKRKFAKR